MPRWTSGAHYSIDDVRRSARRKLPRFVFDYIDGGAEDERCLRRNLAEIDSLCLLPRVLRDTRALDMSVQLFGQRWRAPMGIAPLGLTGLVRPGGDILMARAAAAQGMPFVLSTASNSRLEEVRDAAPGAILWQQLYVMEARGIAEQLVARAKAARFQALVLTVDVPVSGQRRRDLRHGFRLPFRPGLRACLDLARQPAWVLRLLRHGMPDFANLAPADGDGQSAQARAALLARTMDRSLDWDSLAWLRRLWDGPLLLKGILHPDDAARALQYGIDGVIVSNHGGRQLDAAPATMAVLPAVLDAVGTKMPVLVDSGFRRGSDVAKALACGAQAVLLGRAPLYGLAAGGEAGVQEVLAMLAADLERSMILAGAARTGELGPAQLMAARANP